MAALDYQVAATADDASQVAAGGVGLNTSPMANCDTTGVWNGWRFRGVTIPDGATITAAYLTFHFPISTQDEPDVMIYAEDGSNPAEFSTTAYSISDRSRTTASVNWSSAGLGTAAAWYNTADISTIIQELVDSYSYASGAPMVFMWTTRAADGSRDTAVTDYYANSSLAGKLHIEYSGGGPAFLAAWARNSNSVIKVM